MTDKRRRSDADTVTPSSDSPRPAAAGLRNSQGDGSASALTDETPPSSAGSDHHSDEDLVRDLQRVAG